MNFICKADTTPMVRFIRVSYTRPKFGLPPGGLYVPRLLSKKTFVPSMTSQADGRVETESAESMFERIKRWFSHIGGVAYTIPMIFHFRILYSKMPGNKWLNIFK